MASPATAAFLTAWRKENPQPALLVEVALTDPSSQTLKLTNRAGFTTPDGTYWEPLVHETDAIDAPGSYLSNGVDLCSFTFTLRGERFAYQAAGERLGLSLKTYRWQGMVVTAWLYESSLTALSDRLQVFKGEVVDVELSATKIVVVCVQRQDWNSIITPTVVSRKAYPRALERSFGLSLPILMGYGDARPMRGDWPGTFGGTDRNRFDRAGGAIPMVQGIMVDTGRGGSSDKAKVLFAGHDVETNGVGIPTSGTNIFMLGSGASPIVLEPAGGDIVNSSTEAGFLIPDDASTGYYVLGPSEVRVPASFPAKDPRYILDLLNETTYAILDYDASQRNLQIPLPNVVDPPGEYIDATAVIGYRTIGGATNLKLVFRNNVLASQRNDAITASVPPTTMLGGSIVGHEPTVPWQFGDCDLRVEFQGVGTGVKCYVYFIALIINFKPRRDAAGLAGRWMKKIVMKPGGIVGVQRFREPVTIDLESDFFGNVFGRPDDGSGTHSGFASLALQLSCDIAYYLLDIYLGQSTTTVELGGSVHGSFTDARTKLKTWSNKVIEHFLQINSPEAGVDVLTDLSRDSLSWIFINRFTDKFCWHVWKTGAVVDYDRTIHPDDVIEREYLKVSKIPKSRILTSIRIPYLWDAYRKAYASEVRCGPDGSSAGYNYLALRDQNMTVVASESDRFDFKDSTGTERNATLTAADYTPISFAQHLAARMGVADGTRTYVVGWGGQIVSGYNDKIDFDVGGGELTATLNAGTYAMEALATEVARALNAASSGFSCSYSRTTRKFTISKGAAFTIRWNTGTNVATGAATTLGYDTAANDATVTTTTSDYIREEERFAIGGAKTTLQILWETGVNGLNGTKRYSFELVGFDPLRDTDSTQTSYVGVCPKNSREQTLASARTKYGARREHFFEGRTLISTDSAREIRDRLVDLNSSPATVVTFRSTKVPDLERGRVIQFSSDFDSLIPFPKPGSDGSWAGKKFWVVETRQQAGPERWDTEVTCVEAA